MTVDKLAIDVALMQEQGPLGGIFKALYVFAERTLEHFYCDLPLPMPILSLDREANSKKGSYRQRDGAMLTHRININPYMCRTGTDAAEILAHELVHLWEHETDQTTRHNYHGSVFVECMADYGIVVTPPRGFHIGYEGTTWQDWLDRNEDLQLDQFLMPGMNEERPKRQLIKHECPQCHATFRSRLVVAAMCTVCDLRFEVA